MAEDMNVELSHELSHRAARQNGRWEQITEIIEAVALGLVAVATAWGGYQAARWDGRQALEKRVLVTGAGSSEHRKRLMPNSCPSYCAIPACA